MSDDTPTEVEPPASEPGAQRWKCTCAYDGTSFDGWQSQVGAMGIQEVIETRLAQIFK